ncbi:hypothetical protein GCM10010168_15980 [Actinoplanes ianthinogenes]|uniref:Uncharacterized protein n=1 Tax=Actinoplanes ianthinogenes TaxID=122358 RepID=A0ABN6CH31_9ACTN|nr:hypothetical protein Aiant_54420 [Actinoplanes ianthinogenes]GGQ99968.1 hypothetical protein GCM10010168_15980 [Actinoplanes ianthinogenes]
MAGPAVAAVAKTHSARSAASGTATIAMIFDLIDQLRLLIKLRPEGVRQGTATHRDPEPADQKWTAARARCAWRRIRKDVRHS